MKINLHANYCLKKVLEWINIIATGMNVKLGISGLKGNVDRRWKIVYIKDLIWLMIMVLKRLKMVIVQYVCIICGIILSRCKKMDLFLMVVTRGVSQEKDRWGKDLLIINNIYIVVINVGMKVDFY